MKNADMPAMPVELSGFGPYPSEVYAGLTKREMFAMHAMQGLLAANSGWRNSNPMTHDIIVNEAAYIADALLEELELTK